MRKATRKWKYEHRNLSDLRPHPANAIYANLSKVGLQSLVADMKARGQQHAIDILPDGTIVGGHQRCLAAILLGWTTIRCRVRYDLARQGEDAIEEFLLRDNFNRRHPHPLQIARVYRRLKELERKKTPRHDSRGDVRDFIAERFGKSGRTLDRWLRLLDTPTDVQDAVIEEKLKLVDGGKVADLPEDVQRKIAAKIRKGQSPHDVVQSYIGKAKPKPANIGTLISRCLRDLAKHSEQLGPKVDQINSPQWAADLPTICDALDMLTRLRARIEKVAADFGDHDLLDRYSKNKRRKN